MVSGGEHRLLILWLLYLADVPCSAQYHKICYNPDEATSADDSCWPDSRSKLVGMASSAGLQAIQIQLKQ